VYQLDVTTVSVAFDFGNMVRYLLTGTETESSSKLQISRDKVNVRLPPHQEAPTVCTVRYGSFNPRVVTLTASLPCVSCASYYCIFFNEPDYPYLYYLNSYTGGVRDECPFIGFVNGTQVVSGQRYGHSDVDYHAGIFNAGGRLIGRLCQGR
jgi:hypothetical protein